MVSGFLILEDGFYLPGRVFGAVKSSIGEVVFNTSMTGYQEILTDPSYYGQIVVMTYPLIGNYGINTEDVESHKVWLSGFVVKELSRIYSNWRASQSLEDYLKENGVVGITGVDTRALTRHIRLQGAMQGAIVPESELDSIRSWVGRVKDSPHLQGRNIAKDTSTKEPYEITGVGRKGVRVVVIDCGVKRSILHYLSQEAGEVIVLPWNSTVKQVLSYRPSGVLFSNGPGDPSAVVETVELARELLGKVSVWGICLGHQILGIAMGGKTYKLKFGHHGGNHPVKELSTGRIDITAQNHGFCVDPDSIKGVGVQITHRNLYDGTVEGIYSKKFNVMSVQFHPEAAPGPFDATYIFKRFMEAMDA